MNVPGIKHSFRGWRASASRLLWSPDLESSRVISLTWFIKSPRELKLGSTPVPCNESADAQVLSTLRLISSLHSQSRLWEPGGSKKTRLRFPLAQSVHVV